MTDNAVNEILSGIDLNALAGAVGATPAEVEQVAAVAVPTLLGSFQANAADPEGEASLLGALKHHTGELNYDEIDTEDGRKILGHAFANDPQRLAGLAGQDSGLLAKLLPILAPIVLNWLANQFLGGGQQASRQQSSGGDVIGDLLGGLLGGGQTQQSGGGLGDLIGGLLGGGQAQSGGGGLGDILGGLLGGEEAPAPKRTQSRKQEQSGGDLLGDLLGQILGGGR